MRKLSHSSSGYHRTLNTLMNALSSAKPGKEKRFERVDMNAWRCIDDGGLWFACPQNMDGRKRLLKDLHFEGALISGNEAIWRAEVDLRTVVDDPYIGEYAPDEEDYPFKCLALMAAFGWLGVHGELLIFEGVNDKEEKQ